MAEEADNKDGPEVTPEMIEAGVAALDRAAEDDPRREIVRDILQAALSAVPSPKASSPES